MPRVTRLLLAIGAMLLGLAARPAAATTFVFSGTVAAGSESYSNGSFGFTGDPAGLPFSGSVTLSGAYDLISGLPGTDFTSTYFSDVALRLTFNGQTLGFTLPSDTTRQYVVFDLNGQNPPSGAGGGGVDLLQLVLSAGGSGLSAAAESSGDPLASSALDTPFTITSDGVASTILFGVTRLLFAPSDPLSFAFYSYDITLSNAPVPEPASLALLGAGVLGLGLVRRRRGAG